MGKHIYIKLACLNLFQLFLNFKFGITFQRPSFKTSADLCWMVTRNTSCVMVKGRLSKTKVFTKDPLSLTGVHSCSTSGLVGARGVGIAPASDNKGVVLLTKKVKMASKPSGSLNSVTFKKGRRAVLTAVGNSVKGYDKTKKRAAMKKASAVLRSQRPRVGKKTKKD